MEFAETRIVNDFFNANPDFSKPENWGCNPIAIVVDDYIYISCLIKTQTSLDYDVIYDPGLTCNLLKSKSKAFEEDDYWSAYNRGFSAKKN